MKNSTAEILPDESGSSNPIKPIDILPEPVLSCQQSQGIINRMYGLRQSLISLQAQTDAVIAYLKRNQ